MRIAIFSDIHGNLHALEAMWADLQAQSPDAVYCLGDLVGYGAFPNEVTAFVRDQGIETVIGNYDDGVGFNRDDCGCVYKDPEDDVRGKRSLMWTRAHATEESKAFLRGLQPDIRLNLGGERLLLVHGSPRRINEYLYEDRPHATFARIAAGAEADHIFFGHTHLPYRKQVEGTWFVNTGSVGMPKDGDPRAGYALLDLNRDPRIDFRRVEYDVTAAATAIRESDLPDAFALQIETAGATAADRVADAAGESG